jgi:hypothetical protein
MCFRPGGTTAAARTPLDASDRAGTRASTASSAKIASVWIRSTCRPRSGVIQWGGRRFTSSSGPSTGHERRKASLSHRLPYTRGDRDFANDVTPCVILVDGRDLAGFMIAYAGESRTPSRAISAHGSRPAALRIAQANQSHETSRTPPPRHTHAGRFCASPTPDVCWIF